MECIQRAVINGQSQVAHRFHPNGISAIEVFYHHAALKFAYAHDGDLRLVDDDRRCQKAAAHAVVGDGECTAADCVRRKFVLACRADQFAQTFGNAEQIKRLRAMQYGDDETFITQRRADTDQEAYRLYKEPLRLGPRYLRYNSIFVLYLLWDVLGRWSLGRTRQ